MPVIILLYYYCLYRQHLVWIAGCPDVVISDSVILVISTSSSLRTNKSSVCSDRECYGPENSVRLVKPDYKWDLF